MKKFMICAGVALLLATPAMAQLANKDYNFVLSPSDIDVLNEALMSVPYGKAFPVINKLRSQVLAQQPKPEPKPAEKTEPKPDAPAPAK